jgi:hypothetical protein
MKPHIQSLITLLSKKDFKSLLALYMKSTEDDNIDQLAFIYQQGQKSLAVFEFYQQVAIKFIQSKTLPNKLIAQINTSDALSFFTPALQLINNFNKINNQQRNVLHYLFSSTQHSLVIPPFNYLRSMMLFESNEYLTQSLTQRDCKNLTPLEVYFFTNNNFNALANHELTALFALIEIETIQQSIDLNNLPLIITQLKVFMRQQNLAPTQQLQRILLVATYYSLPIADIIKMLNA